MYARPKLNRLPYEFKRILRKATEQRLSCDRPVLLFSGGTDSLAVFWTLLELSPKLATYTFRLEEKVSQDSRAANAAAAHWGIVNYPIVIKDGGAKNTAEEVKRVVRKIGSARKTHVECAWPFIHIEPRIPEGAQVWCGINADDLYGSARSVATTYGKDASPRAFAEFRRKLLADEKTSAWEALGKVFDKSEVVSPYRDPELIDLMCKYSWGELNRPRQKWFVVEAFRKQYEQLAIYRRNDNLQCGSGVRDRMALMLEDESVNNRKHKKVQQLYKEWLDE